MSKFRGNRAFAAGVLLGLLTNVPVMADDTEVYVGGNLSQIAVPPNILFVVDTSGSMGSDVFTQSTYNPNTDYSGLPTSCAEFTNLAGGKVYWSTGTVNLSCTSDRWFPKPNLLCKAASNSLYTGSGFYQDRMARHAFGTWTRLSQTDEGRVADVECASDSGVHGPNDASPDVYAEDSAAGWTQNPDNEIDWGAETNYTVYSANFMNYLRSDPSVTKTRLQVVQDVVSSVVGSVNGINIGLMRFSRDQEGGMVSYAMRPIETGRAGFVAALNNFAVSGPTPLTEVMWEAMRYYRGDPVDYGLTSDPVPSVPDSQSGGNYISPIEFQCQRNSVILLTDGAANGDNGRDAQLQAMPNFQLATGAANCPHPPEHISPDGDADDGQCLDQLAAYMANEDQMPTQFPDRQLVQTYTIGFQLDHPLLRSTAFEGDGLYFTADDTAGLTNAFTAIINEVLAANATFSSPAVSVNSFSQTTHRNELYFTLFRPEAAPHWDGNLKKYRLAFDEDANGDIVPVVKDANGQDAVDPVTGFFRDTAQSFWSSAIDGSDVREGGAANELTTTRNVYTYTGATPPNNENLTLDANEVNEGNAAITAAMLDMDPGATFPTRDELLQWARGIDIDGSYGAPGGARRQMGDPLHSQATVVQYGGTEANPDLTVYFTTNDGYLHAVSEVSGAEQFAFIPQELLKNLRELYQNNITENRPYGLDSPVVPWVNDENGDGVISGADEHVFIYFGMRRGGYSYYAMDVTNRSAPVLKWKITNDTDGDGTPDGDFAEMGETWSQPIVREVMFNGQEKTALIFGGGYDTLQDSNILAADDSMGRAIYVVDADTGERLWWAGPSGSGANLELANMTNSIPSVVNGLDLSGNGITDRLYVGDTRAQFWRIDINENNTGAGNFATGGRIAALGGDDDPADNRRFYHPADIAVIAPPGQTPYISIVIGSGYQAHPLQPDVHDRIYMLKDRNIFSAPAAYVTRTEADLFDATDNVIGEGDAGERATALGELSSSDGWYIVLSDPSTGAFNGEKVLGRPLIVSGVALVPSFIPNSPSGVVCGPGEGLGLLYFLNVVDATPVRDYDDSGDPLNLTRSDRTRQSLRGGIAPSPTLIIARDEETGATRDVGCSATDCFNLPGTGAPVKTYWFEN